MTASNNRKRSPFVTKVERLSENVEAVTGLVKAVWKAILVLLAPVALFAPGLLPTVDHLVTFLGRIMTM